MQNKGIQAGIGVLAALLILVGGVWWSNSLSDSTTTDGGASVISRNGIHWHPELEIYISGEKQEIPEGVGLSGISHNPIHTHEDLPSIHLEFSGRVTEDDIRLGRFFEIWGKTFNKDQLFEYENSEEGQVRMFVNGKENIEFEGYIMRDGDKIEIRYE